LAQQISSAYETPLREAQERHHHGTGHQDWPHTCSSNITTAQEATTRGRKTSPRGRNHFSKRRSESGKESRKKVKTKITGLKTKETKKTKRTERKRVKKSWKVKIDKVKAKEKDLERSETEREKQKEIKRQQTKTEKFPTQKYSISIPFAFAFFILSHLAISLHHLHVSLLYSFQLPLHGISRFQGFGQTLFLQHTALHLAKRTKNFHRNPWDQPDYPEILKPNQRYSIDFTRTHWF
jgi:hypothetical protein